MGVVYRARADLLLKTRGIGWADLSVGRMGFYGILDLPEGADHGARFSQDKTCFETCLNYGLADQKKIVWGLVCHRDLTFP